MKKVVIEVCAGTYCTMMGSMDLVDAIESLSELQESVIDCEFDVRVTPCQDELCQHGALSPVVRIDGEILLQAEAETIMWRLLDKASQREQSQTPSDPEGKKEI